MKAANPSQIPAHTNCRNCGKCCGVIPVTDESARHPSALILNPTPFPDAMRPSTPAISPAPSVTIR